jgi:pyrimidine operon attenuation protein/uracil phosphoribosyltransferase
MENNPPSQILDLFLPGQLDVTLLRLCHQLIEHHIDFKNSAMLAIQPRGVYLGRRMHALLQSLLPDTTLPYGELDVTFFRDDVRRHASPLLANTTKVDFLVEGKRVILVDDVLYTGRTIRAALDAMLAFGRPSSVELLVLVDRNRQRELPVESQYTGITVDALPSEKVIVRLKESGGEDSVRIESR